MEKQTNQELLAMAATLASKGESSCMDCTHNYCCVHQRAIELSTKEWSYIEHLITEDQEDRAIAQLKRMDEVSNVERVFNCPFNDPITGKCEIYEDRFFVCAQYQVFSPKEHCNSLTENRLSVLNPMAVFKVMGASMQYATALKHIEHLAIEGEPSDMMDEWKKHLTKKGKL